MFLKPLLWTLAVVLTIVTHSIHSSASDSIMSASHSETITLGAGCFWCVEAVFESIPGVSTAVSGYSGGFIKNPGYREVCTGRTGHAEVVQVTYDPEKVSLELILEVFFATHDPTTMNRQGADVGSQYRSVIYFHEESQRPTIATALEKAQKQWSDLIVTEVAPFDVFYPAEDYHQGYFELNQEAPYCRAVIAPKMAKFQKEFSSKLSLD